MKKIVSSLAVILSLSACSTIPQEAWFNRGTPESLLDASSEVVNVNISDSSGIDELIGWVNKDVPTRAELYCSAGEPNCKKAREVMRQFGVQFRQMPEPRGSVSLYYERVMARNCENRYIDNSINPYNLPHPTLGCSVATNIVLHVADRKQFVNPDTQEDRDGEKTVQNYRAYQMPADTKSGGSGMNAGSVIRGSDGKGLQ